MANPVAHAMVYFSESSNYHELISAANAVAEEIRQLVTAVPGTAVSVQGEPMRAEKKYRKFNGDGPAKMMAKFRNWEKSQLPLIEDSADNFEAVIEQVVTRLGEGSISDAEETTGWEIFLSMRVILLLRSR